MLINNVNIRRTTKSILKFLRFLQNLFYWLMIQVPLQFKYYFICRHWTFFHCFRILHANIQRHTSSDNTKSFHFVAMSYLYRLAMNVSVETKWEKRKQTANVRRHVPETRNKSVAAAGDLLSTKTQHLSHVSSLIGRMKTLILIGFLDSKKLRYAYS